MVKAFTIYVFFSLLVGVCGYGYITTLQKMNVALETQKNELKNEIEVCNGKMEASNRAEKTIGEIRTIVKTVPSVCDCASASIEPVQLLHAIRGTKNK